PSSSAVTTMPPAVASTPDELGKGSSTRLLISPEPGSRIVNELVIRSSPPPPPPPKRPLEHGHRGGEECTHRDRCCADHAVDENDFAEAEASDDGACRGLHRHRADGTRECSAPGGERGQAEHDLQQQRQQKNQVPAPARNNEPPPMLARNVAMRNT